MHSPILHHALFCPFSRKIVLGLKEKGIAFHSCIEKPWDLSKKAEKNDADVIVFCGVKFMAEVAKILSPSKKVILPDINAGCSLEESCQVKDFKKFKRR